MHPKEYLRLALLGPFAQQSKKAIALRVFIVLLLTILTQVGALLIWPFLSINANNIGVKYQLQRWGAPIISYLLGSWLLVPLLASLFNSVPLPCSAKNRYPIAARSSLTCLANRHYVQKEVKDSMLSVAMQFGRIFPQMEIHYLDAGFPIGQMPLFPHHQQQHRYGKSIDFSFSWKIGKQEPSSSPSPIGYWGYLQSKELGSSQCSNKRLKLDWISFILPKRKLDRKKTSLIIGLISQQQNVQHILLEKHLHPLFVSKQSKVQAFPCTRFQHDDHFHVEFD